MTREEVIAMAREAGFTVGPSRDGPDDVWGVASTLERFAKLVRDDYSNKPWVGLTPEDYDSMRSRVPYIVNDFSFADVAAIVEEKLKEKNTWQVMK